MPDEQPLLRWLRLVLMIFRLIAHENLVAGDAIRLTREQVIGGTT